MLLDEDCNDPITMIGDDGEPATFAQVAIVPYEKELYAILKPISGMTGVPDDEAVIFWFTETEEGENYLKLVTDPAILDSVFEIYLDLVRNCRSSMDE